MNIFRIRVLGLSNVPFTDPSRVLYHVTTRVKRSPCLALCPGTSLVTGPGPRVHGLLYELLGQVPVPPGVGLLDVGVCGTIASPNLFTLVALLQLRLGPGPLPLLLVSAMSPVLCPVLTSVSLMSRVELVLCPVTRPKHPVTGHGHGVDGNQVWVGGWGVHRGKQFHRGVRGVVGSRVENGAMHRGVMVMGVVVVRGAISSLSLMLMSGGFCSGVLCLMLVDSMNLSRIGRL